MNTFNGNVKNIQIQQGNTYAVQVQSANEDIDYDQLMAVIEQIKKSDNLFDDEYRENADQVRNLTEQIFEMAQQKQAPGKIRQQLSLLKDLSVGAAGSLIASGVLKLIEPFIN